MDPLRRSSSSTPGSRSSTSRRTDRANVDGVGDDLKMQILEEGRVFVRALADEGNTDEGFDRAFDVLGDLGLYMAALRRHELTNPGTRGALAARGGDRPRAAHRRVGRGRAALRDEPPRDAQPRRATAARRASPRSPTRSCSSTTTPAGSSGYKRAADALMRIAPIGISHAVAETLFDDAHRALEDVAPFNECSSRSSTSTGSSTACVRTTSRIASGARNTAARMPVTSRASTRSTCSSGSAAANDPYYSQLLVEKMLFMRPDDQASLRDCMRRRSFLDQFLDCRTRAATGEWFRRNAAAFVRVCDAHGRVAAQHHDQLVARFIAAPSKALDESHLAQVTASGPPLPVLLAALEVLRDLRLAAPRDDIASRHGDLSRLREAVV